MSAKDLENALREGGEKVGEGRIRIDSARALQRLKDFRFADPSHWVLEVLRSATLSYAKNVEIRTDSDDVEIFFDGKSFPTDSMKTLLEQALNAANTPDEKRTRLLSLGVAGALGVTASFVKVSSGGIALTLSGDEVQLEESKTKGTQLHLRKAFGWRVAAAFFRGSPEARAIAEAAQRFPGTLTLNGETLKLPPQKQVGIKTVEGKGFRLEARLPLGPPLSTSRIEIDVAGVVVAEREKRLPGLQLEVWLRADDVRRNASGSDVVDDDEIFEAALLALRKVSRDLLNEHGEKLAADPVWRTAFKEQLKDTASLDAQVKQRLNKLPLFRGPAGEGLSIEQISDESRERSIIYVAKREYPKGSYPEATVLLEGEHFAFLLPEGKRVDVSDLVKSKQKIALARARHEAMETEEAVLHDRTWVARAKLDATAVEGEVGFEAGGNGAFVRVLHKGRLMESGELTALSPLRLRAVVDWNRPLADSYFVAEEGDSKLLGLVMKYIENAATKAICEALPKPEVLPHALDLLTRLVTNRNVPFTELPPQLKAAALFPCLESDPVSLDTFYAEPKWYFVDSRKPYGLLQGGRVLVLSPVLKDVLKKLAPKKLEDVRSRLHEEEDVRRRLAGPKAKAVLTPQVVGVKVKIEEEGLRGEVGIPTLPGTKLMLTLIKSGFELETNEHPARYNRAVASIDCDALEPNASWTSAVRDDAFKRVMSVVSEAQRRLAAELVKEKRASWKFGADQFFLAFLKKELVPFDPSTLDDVTRAVASAPVFESVHGPRTLMQLHEQVKRDGRFYVLSSRREVPKDLEVLVELPAIAEVLGEALGTKPEDPSGALATIDARQRLQALPFAEFKLSSPLGFEVRHTEERFTVLAGMREGIGDQASGHVHLDGRVYSVFQVPCALPLEVLVDAPSFEPNTFRELTGDQRSEVMRLVGTAARLVVTKALGAKEDDLAARRVLLLAIGHRLETTLSPEDSERLLTRELFPCTDGTFRSFRQCDEESPQFVTTPMEGELPNRRSIIVAAEAPVRLAVSRWQRAVRVDDELEVQISASRKRASVAKVDEVVSKVQSPWRQKVQERDLLGEIVVTNKHAGRLEVFFEKKPLCVLENALPAPLAGAIDSPRFTPTPGFKGVVEDGNFKEAIEALTGSAERLAARLASAPRVMEFDEALVQLAFWVGSTLAWQWKGKKKAKGKKKENVETQHELMAKEILRANDTTTLSVQDLVMQQREAGHVDVTKQGGKFLEQGRKVWWPRVDEEKWAEPLGFNYRDVTSELKLADSIRQRPKFTTIDSPLPSPWRERVQAPGIEGEIAIGHAPDGKLTIEVLHERMLIETWSSEHPVGGLARVDSSALTPNEQWTGVKRDAAFKSLVTATEGALERLVVRRLASSDSRAFAIAAVKWRSGQAGPLSGVVPTLGLFRDLQGGTMTVGEVFELARKKGKVPVATLHFSSDAKGVVQDSADTRSVLSLIGLVHEDVTGELRRAKNLEQALTARRLESLTWKGDSLVKVNINTMQLKGELAIRIAVPEKDEPGRVTLAKDGISIGVLDQKWPGVVGVIDVKDLSVNDDWTQAEVTKAQRGLIREQVERLFTELAVKTPTYSHEQREVALAYALRFLLDEGTKTASELPRLKGIAAELASAPLFLTTDGEKVTLRAVADEVSTREKVSVLTRSMGNPHGITSCVLATSSMNAPWISSLEDLFGKTRVWRVTDLAEWTQATREADPPEGALELQGLRFLRREVRLLRTGALGHLTPDDLEDVRLNRAGGGTAMRYDKRRKLALLDPEHPDIARALKEAQQRPERLWVLIASIFGLVNRELTHVTDVHEAQLLLALAGHLASNPKLLPTEPS